METKERVLKTSTPTAKKEHICASCGKPIAKGEKYLNIAIKDGKKLVSRKSHLACTLKSKERQERVSFANSPVTEKQFKEQVHNDALAMLETFTFKENMLMAYVPLIITEVAWHYALKVVNEAAQNRISDFKRLSRKVKSLRENYLQNCTKDLTKQDIERIIESAKAFINSCGNDFSIMFYSVNNELKKKWPDCHYLDIRTDACIAQSMIKLLFLHNERMDKLVERKLGGKMPSYRNPINEALLDCMRQYAFPAQVEFTGNMRLSMQIIHKKFNAIDFVVK